MGWHEMDGQFWDRNSQDGGMGMVVSCLFSQIYSHCFCILCFFHFHTTLTTSNPKYPSFYNHLKTFLPFHLIFVPNLIFGQSRFLRHTTANLQPTVLIHHECPTLLCPSLNFCMPGQVYCFLLYNNKRGPAG